MKLLITIFSKIICLVIVFSGFDIFSKLDIRYGEAHMQGRRAQMEDACVANIPLDQKDSALFAIFDGHGGREVSAYCAANISKVLNQIDGPLENRLSKGLDQLDQNLKNSYLGYRADRMGTCAIIALISKRHMVVANIGDSRAILSNNGKAVALSNDQVPSRPDERARIGRNIYNGRVGGRLNITRAIGDYDLNSYGLTAQSELHSVDIGESAKFLILACDGIFERNILNRQDAVDIVGRSLAQNKYEINAEKIAARALIDTAYKRGSGDNLSAIVVTFGRQT